MVIDNGLGPNKRLKSLSCFPLIINTSVPSSDQSFCFLWSGSLERERFFRLVEEQTRHSKKKKERHKHYTQKEREGIYIYIYIDSIHTHHQHMEIYRERCLSLSSLYFTILSLSSKIFQSPFISCFFFMIFNFQKQNCFQEHR